MPSALIGKLPEMEPCLFSPLLYSQCSPWLLLFFSCLLLSHQQTLLSLQSNCIQNQTPFPLLLSATRVQIQWPSKDYIYDTAFWLSYTLFCVHLSVSILKCRDNASKINPCLRFCHRDDLHVPQTGRTLSGSLYSLSSLAREKFL